MNIARVLKEVISALAAVVVYSSPVRESRSSNTVEFFMTEDQHDQVNWYGTDQSLESTRDSSEKAFGDTSKCPETVKTDPNLPVSAKSTCPWYYKVDHNPNRYPANILYAVTPCNAACIDGSDELQCLPVVRTIEVMIEKGHDESGNIIYETMEAENTVAWTCGARYMAENIQVTTASAPDFYDQR